MQEFLTPEWIGPIAPDIYPYIRDALVEFWDMKKPYRHLILYPMIGFGKSFASVLSSLFTTTHLTLMRNTKAFFGLNEATVLVQVLISFTLQKASELLLEPFVNILESATMFEKVRTQESMKKRSREFQKGQFEKIYWTTAAPTSALSFPNGINYKLASHPAQLLGAAQPLDCKIKKQDGSWTTMGELKVGDKIASPSEGETTVVGIFPQGKQKTYKITLEDGRSTRCNASHLWQVKYRKTPDGELIDEVVKLQFIIDHPEWEFFIVDEADCKGEENGN
jgi:hypothetical protein